MYAAGYLPNCSPSTRHSCKIFRCSCPWYEFDTANEARSHSPFPVQRYTTNRATWRLLHLFARFVFVAISPDALQVLNMPMRLRSWMDYENNICHMSESITHSPPGWVSGFIYMYVVNRFKTYSALDFARRLACMAYEGGQSECS